MADRMNAQQGEPDTAAKVPDRSRRRFGQVPVRFLLPNIITLLAVCSGVTAIRLGIEGRYELAVAAVILACVLDAMDGRIARFLKGSSRFGAELDSLADFVNFGVVPSVLIWMWSLHALKNLGWIFALGLAICCALRLARFNVAIDDPDKPRWMVGYFVGIPAPAGALLAMAPMYLGFLGIVEDGVGIAPLVLCWTALVAGGVISRIPTFSGKGTGKRVRRDLVLPIVAAIVFGAVLLASYPWETLTFAVAVYVVLIPCRHPPLPAPRSGIGKPEQAANQLIYSAACLNAGCYHSFRRLWISRPVFALMFNMLAAPAPGAARLSRQTVGAAQKHRRQNQRQQSGKRQAEGNGGGQAEPTMLTSRCRSATVRSNQLTLSWKIIGSRPKMVVMVVSSTGRKRCAAVPQYTASRTAKPLRKHVVVRIDQDNCIVHHDAGQRHDTGAGHDDRETPDPVTIMPIKHACQGHDQCRKGENGVIKAVELGHQDHEHDEYGNQHRPGQKGLR